MERTVNAGVAKFEYWLIRISMVGILVFVILLNNDSWFFESSNSGARLRLGKVSDFQRDVRRRVVDDFVWLPLESESPIFLGDSIFTGSESTVAIQLEGGVELIIDPDSLVVLDRTADLTRLKLRFGSLTGHLNASRGGRLSLDINDQSLDLAGTGVEFLLDRKNSNSTSLSITEGMAQLKQAGKLLTVAKNQQLPLGRGLASAEDQLLLAKPRVQFINTEVWAKNKSIWTDQPQPLKFQWETEGVVSRYEIEIWQKGTGAESQLLKQETLTGTTYEWKPPADEGSILWKVRALAENGETLAESDRIQWNFGVLIPPAWTLEHNPMVLFLKDWNKDVGPQALWTTSLKTQQYRLQWSSSSDFAERTEEILPSGPWSLPPWPLGRYYLRVRSEFLGRPSSMWSEILVVEVTAPQVREAAIPTPVPVAAPAPALKPNLSTPINYPTPQIQTVEPVTITVPKADSPLPPALVKLRWKSVSQIALYRLEVSSEAKFAKPFYTEVVASKEQVVKIQNPGKYFARITGLDAQKAAVTKTSEPLGIEVLLDRPLRRPELQLPKDQVSYILSKMKNPQIWLEWKSDALATEHQVEFAKNRRFEKVLHTIVTKDSKVLLDHKTVRGKLFWRVKGTNPEKKLKSPWSEDRALTIIDIESDD